VIPEANVADFGLCIAEIRAGIADAGLKCFDCGVFGEKNY
jgi:hypothetical protein